MTDHVSWSEVVLIIAMTWTVMYAVAKIVLFFS
jgi:hypothetical protein